MPRYSWEEGFILQNPSFKIEQRKDVICKKSSEKIQPICNYKIRHETCEECDQKFSRANNPSTEKKRSVLTHNSTTIDMVETWKNRSSRL